MTSLRLLIASLVVVGCSSSSSSDDASEPLDQPLTNTSLVSTYVEPATNRVRYYAISFFLDANGPSDLATIDRVEVQSIDGKASGEGQKSCPLAVTVTVPPPDAKMASTPVPSFEVRIVPDPGAPWQLGVGDCSIPIAPTLGENDGLKFVDLHGLRKDGGRWSATTSLEGKVPGR